LPILSPNPCAEAKRVIEIDGDVHADPDQAAYDEARARWLEERGYRVLRFQAREVDKDLRAVVQAIREACEARRRLEELGYFKVPREG
jgi:very-short-patch-repair endonuclease